MGFFMWPIVTGNLRGTTAWQADFAHNDRPRGIFLSGSPEILRGCPTITLLHRENPTARHDRRHHGWVAQLAEQWTENPRVGGSIPPPATTRFHSVERPLFPSGFATFQKRRK